MTLPFASSFNFPVAGLEKPVCSIGFSMPMPMVSKIFAPTAGGQLCGVKQFDLAFVVVTIGEQDDNLAPADREQP